MTQAPTQLVISCRGVTKHYGQGSATVAALRGVDLGVNAGELLMLVGPSGCGKTTLISVIAGILDRDNGDCTVFGNDFTEMSRQARTLWRGRNVGFVFQAFNLLPTLTAADNVAVPLLILAHRGTFAKGRAREALASVGLGDRTEALPSQLSGGEQQRVPIARALVHEPRLMVCDEPTSALDHDTGQIIMELLRTVALQKDRALVIVTHDQRIFGFADRIATMEDGWIKEIVNNPKELMTWS